MKLNKIFNTLSIAAMALLATACNDTDAQYSIPDVDAPQFVSASLTEEKPVYMMVAFDKGKTFRHEKYDFYKGGRGETPDELKVQFPKAKELLTYMGIKYYEIVFVVCK